MTRTRRAGLYTLLVITALLGLAVFAAVLEVLTRPWPIGGPR